MKQRLTTALAAAFLSAVALIVVACIPTNVEALQGNDPCVDDPAAQSMAVPAARPISSVPQPVSAYVVGRSDTLTIRVSPDLAPTPNQQCSRDYIVGADGMINFCYLGTLKVDGLTQRQIEDLIQKEFRARQYYTDPVATVEIKDYRSQVVYVNGAVVSPGDISLKGNQMTLNSAVAAAGGYNATAGMDVYIKRPRATAAPGSQPLPVSLEDTASETFHYNRRDMMDNFEDPPVQNGDTIWVSQGEVFYINGEIKASGQKVWEPCMNLGQAIAMASGQTEKASLRRSFILRPNAKGGYDRIGNLKLDTRIQPKDQINISPKLF
jgi:protein involved in polysaccharide export with SLBB domain